MLAGLVSISNRVVLIPAPGDDLLTSVQTAVTLLSEIHAAFSLNGIKAY